MSRANSWPQKNNSARGYLLDIRMIGPTFGSTCTASLPECFPLACFGLECSVQIFDLWAAVAPPAPSPLSRLCNPSPPKQVAQPQKTCLCCQIVQTDLNSLPFGLRPSKRSSRPTLENCSLGAWAAFDSSCNGSRFISFASHAIRVPAAKEKKKKTAIPPITSSIARQIKPACRRPQRQSEPG